jgi:hypothetical protein
VVSKPQRLIEEIGAMSAQGWVQAQQFEIALTNAELNYYQVMTQLPGQWDIGCNTAMEIALIGAALGGGFENTNELHVLNYKEAMEGPNKAQWTKAVVEEHDRMVKMGVWKAAPRRNFQRDLSQSGHPGLARKSPTGPFVPGRVNTRGFEQLPGVHYDLKSVAAPVTNNINI